MAAIHGKSLIMMTTWSEVNEVPWAKQTSLSLKMARQKIDVLRACMVVIRDAGSSIDLNELDAEGLLITDQFFTEARHTRRHPGHLLRISKLGSLVDALQLSFH